MMRHRRKSITLAVGAALATVLVGCMPQLGAINMVDVPGSIEKLALMPPSRPVPPSGPVPVVRVSRPAPAASTAPILSTIEEEVGAEDADADDEEGDGIPTDLEAIAQGIVAIRQLENIVGASEAAVRERIGNPVMVAPRPPGIEWNYRQGDCVLQVYFFMELATRDFRVLSYDLTGDDIDARRECASRFTREQQGAAVSDAVG